METTLLQSGKMDRPPGIEALLRFLERHPRITVLSGAGCSTGSGIPDYRDEDGNWKHRQPMQFRDFVHDAGNRRRYWAQSFAGWRRVADARPNAAHEALARLERRGGVRCVITQNVDDLHRRAGSRNVIDLHGVLGRVRCIDCDSILPRTTFQDTLAAMNPDWHADVTAFAPDGDASLDRGDPSGFRVPDCVRCGGVLKPDVVFFGESVPGERVAAASGEIRRSDALLIIGSSLMVFSGYRFAQLASEAGKPIAIVNRGRTRADDLATCKISGDCATLLADAADALAV